MINGYSFGWVWQSHQSPGARVMFPEHSHFIYELGIVLRGRCVWNIKGRDAVEVNAGEAILIAPKRKHAEYFLERSIVAWIGFLAPRDGMVGVKCHTAFSLGAQFTEVLNVVERLASEEARRLSECEARLALHIADLALLLRRCTRRYKAAIPKPVHNDVVDRMDAAARFLERNCTEEQTLTYIARHHGISVSHFGYLFRQRFGMSPGKFKQQCKLRHLEAAVISGVNSIKGLMEELTITDSGYFCRWLKRNTGLRPKAWLEAAKAKPPLTRWSQMDERDSSRTIGSKRGSGDMKS